jgi:hypothetical protein
MARRIRTRLRALRRTYRSMRRLARLLPPAQPSAASGGGV